ncbi:MAG: hypothetical protein M0Q94_14775 [Candidatus Cloacimonetes bacterium]|nr:hypothetical protein [Candidatus Cloacimonadota bacterium]
MEDEKYSYRFSKNEEEELKNLKDKYVAREKTPLEQVRDIESEVNKQASIPSYTIGIIGSIVLGIGMCLTMVWTRFFALGIIIGIIGIAIIAINYPLYVKRIQKLRKAQAEKVAKIASC